MKSADPEVVLAAPEDLVDSAQRLSEVCQWLAEAARRKKTVSVAFSLMNIAIGEYLWS